MSRVFVKGTIRRTGTNTWEALDDATHRPEGFATITANSTAVTVNYATAGDAVITGSATPDETLAAAGIVCGPSIGLTSAVIKFGRNGSLINPDTISNANANVWISIELEVDDG